MAANRSPKPASKKKLLYPAGLVVILLMLGILEAANITHFIHSGSQATKPTGPTKAQQEQAAKVEADQKKQAVEHPTATAPAPAPSDSSISLTTRTETNGTVTVFTNLGPISGGACTLTVTNGAATVTQTATVIYQTQYSTCAGFSVPKTNLGAGNWTLKLDVTNDGVTASKTVQAEIN